LNDRAFSRMKPGVPDQLRARPVVARALVRALDAKKIAGCALDTNDPEPLPDPTACEARERHRRAARRLVQRGAIGGLQAGAPGEVRRVLTGSGR